MLSLAVLILTIPFVIVVPVKLGTQVEELADVPFFPTVPCAPVLPAAPCGPASPGNPALVNHTYVYFDHLFVIDTGATFEADAPLFAASVDVNSGTPALGAAGGTAVNAGVAGAFQAVPVGVVIPEPGVSVLALFAAGFLALRRRR